ncbi:signal peptidase II [Nocardia flavorosea]|uniref:Lipoprotein signal peptidase n=1 Tax=Nocardia flavorosea TaxID=53429 RepID=A0A846YMB4_9NOCA|nr:signal peptidase II [Nocardia flavorosea]NKY58714.1 signal peptidase II [Nocardia flavorosea]
MMGVVTEDPTREQDPDRPSGDGQQPRQRLPLLLTIAVTLFTLDLITKVVVVQQIQPGERIPLIGDFVQLVLVRNPGAAFSMATGMTWLLTLIAAAVVIGVLRIGRTLRSPLWAIGLGGVLGGAFGNLMDRLFRAPGPMQGHVVDFFSVGSFPVFNVADSSIVCGAILLVVLTVFGFEPDGTRYNRNTPSENATASDAPPATPRPGPADHPGSGTGESPTPDRGEPTRDPEPEASAGTPAARTGEGTAA